jgi:hypothetical protein
LLMLLLCNSHLMQLLVKKQWWLRLVTTHVRSGGAELAQVEAVQYQSI